MRSQKEWLSAALVTILTTGGTSTSAWAAPANGTFVGEERTSSSSRATAAIQADDRAR